MHTLLNGNAEALSTLEIRVATHLGFNNLFTSVGQVYPRSLDFEVTALLVQLASGPSNFATTVRLMAGQELATEGFLPGQVGSSAMPHKMNARSCERINGFHVILRGYMNMCADLSGQQWNEGDVSCSVVRRVALPGAFFAADGQLEAALTVLAEMGFYEGAIAQELKQYLPFLASTSLLMEALRKGGGRESVHEAIKEHAVLVAEALRNGEISENDLAQRLADDDRVPLNFSEISDVLNNPRRFAASAPEQVEIFAEEVGKWTKRFPEAKNLVPEALL
jgi:adenylosuccinate lyase